MANQSGEKTLAELSTARRWMILVLASIGSSIIYAPAYLKAVFYDPLLEALNVTNTELGAVFGAYAMTALVCYLPSGIIADKVRMRTLSTSGFIITAVLTAIYATLPNLTILYLVFVGMGISTILVWWGVRYKLVRLVCTEEEYPGRIGLSYGLYGVAGLLIGLISTVVVSLVGNNLRLGVSVYLYFLAALIFILGVMSWVFIPKFAGELGGSSGLDLSEFRSALRDPVVWLAAFTLFFVYFFYTGVTYTTPYMTGVLGVSLAAATIVANVRNYGITLLSGPLFGQIAVRFRPSLTIAAGSAIFVACLVALILLPRRGGIAVVACGLVILLGFIANGAFGVVSAQLTEGKVPLSYFGAATGMLSIIGFLPDTFSSTWFGAIMDARTDPNGVVSASAYQQIFLILIVTAVLAIACSLALWVYLRRHPRIHRTDMLAESLPGQD